MRILWALTVWVGLTLLAGGCQDGNKSPAAGGGRIDDASIPSKVDVVVEGGGSFPDELAGTWRADGYGWELVVENDGSLSSAVISMGRVRIRPGVETVVPMIQGGRGEYEPGPWTVHYDPASRMLTVVIVIRRLRIEVGDSRIVGSSRDTFVGEVRPGGRFWEAVWTSFPQYEASTDGGQTFVPLEGTDEYGLEQNVLFQSDEKGNP